MGASYIHTKRKTRVSRLIIRFLTLLYILLLGAAVAYLWLFTKDRFTSIATFKIAKPSGSSGDIGFAQLALPGLGDAGYADAQVAIGYINSTDLLLELEKEFKLVEHYNSPTADFVFRMSHDDNLEERLKYYRNRIYAHYEVATGLTYLTVDTFKPELSKKIADALIKKTEYFINHTSQKTAKQQLEFYHLELDRSAKKVEEVYKELLTLQNQHNLVKPDEVITANFRAIQEMRQERFRLEAQLTAITRDSPGSPRLTSMQSRIRSLGELIDQESTKLSGPESDRLNQILVEYKQLEQKLEFATRLRTSAELQLEKNRIDAIALSRFFNLVQTPYLPEDVAIPRRPYATAVLVILGLLLLIILRALASSALDRG